MDDKRETHGMNTGQDAAPHSDAEASPSEKSLPKRMKKVTFDDFQITREGQAAQVEEERRAWREREERMEREKPSLLRFAAPRIKSFRDEMIGVQNKLPFFRKPQRPLETADGPDVHDSDVSPGMAAPDPATPYFAEHERSVVRVTRVLHEEAPPQAHGRAPATRPGFPQPARNGSPNNSDILRTEVDQEPAILELGQSEAESVQGVADTGVTDTVLTDDDLVATMVAGLESAPFEDEALEEETSEEAEEPPDALESYDSSGELISELLEDGSIGEEILTATHSVPPPIRPAATTEFEYDDIPVEPKLDPALGSYLDALRAFDSRPRRATDVRDPRADFVVLLGDLLDILRDELNATSAMFFWVNSKKQELVLESAALDDRAYQFLASDKRFPIELDAVSRIVSKRKPELHSTIAPQAELDLIPYYRDAIGIASFAGMPVLFGDALVAVLTVDSAATDHFSAETLRILTDFSKLISGLIRSYIEKYDLLAAARALEASKKLHEIISPDSTLRVRSLDRNSEYIFRSLTEAAGEIIDWDWLAAASFDESRRLWSISSLQSKRGGVYVQPMTPISHEESIVGKSLASGKSERIDYLTPQHVRYNVEEDRHSAAGHSFLAIPIRTSAKNYGVLAIEHSERARFTGADVETLEHLARGAATALEIIALGEMVGARALTDLLTGLLNKRGLLERTQQELARAMQFDEPLTLVLFEIDGASEFSSRFSQEDSDSIVLAIARLLRFGARPFDVVARAGEHSFAVLLVRMPDEEGYLWSEKMRKMIVSEVIAIGKRSYSVTVSIGVSGARRDGTVDELIEGAELALERARELGGNNVIVY